MGTLLEINRETPHTERERTLKAGFNFRVGRVGKEKCKEFRWVQFEWEGGQGDRERERERERERVCYEDRCNSKERDRERERGLDLRWIHLGRERGLALRGFNSSEWGELLPYSTAQEKVYHVGDKVVLSQLPRPIRSQWAVGHSTDRILGKSKQWVLKETQNSKW